MQPPPPTGRLFLLRPTPSFGRSMETGSIAAEAGMYVMYPVRYQTKPRTVVRSCEGGVCNCTYGQDRTIQYRTRQDRTGLGTTVHGTQETGHRGNQLFFFFPCTKHLTGLKLIGPGTQTWQGMLLDVMVELVFSWKWIFLILLPFFLYFLSVPLSYLPSPACGR